MMNTSDAIAIVKGRTPDCSREEIRSAWQHLVNTGTVWNMEKYGRGQWYAQMASCMLEAGILERNAA